MLPLSTPELAATHPSLNPGPTPKPCPYQALTAPNATAILLACLNPTAEHTFGSLATLGYARKAGNLKVREVAAARPKGPAKPTEIAKATPREAADTTPHCRCDFIETSAHGELYARCAGDPSDPLVLYVHDPHELGSDSSMWNELVLEMHAVSSAATHPDARELVEQVGQLVLQSDGPSLPPSSDSTVKPSRARVRRVTTGDVTNGQGKQRTPRPGSAPLDRGRISMGGAASAVVATKRLRRVSAGDVTRDVTSGQVFTPTLQAVNEGSISVPVSASVQSSQATPSAVKGRPNAARPRRASAPDILNNARLGSRLIAAPINRFEQSKQPQELIELVHLLTEELKVRAEHMKSFACELCGGMLMQPTPLSPCSHVLCGACHTATVGSGFIECPVCFKPILKHPHTAAHPLGKEPAKEVSELSATALAATPLLAAGKVAWRGGAVDEAHGEALRRRLEAALRSIGSQQDRAEWEGLVLAAQTAQGVASREEELATRLILEFGTELPSGCTEAAPFCRIVEVRRGSAAAALSPALQNIGQFVQSVEICTLATAAATADAELEETDGHAQMAAGEQAGAHAAPQRRHMAVVTWASVLRLPPLEIHFAPTLQAYDGEIETSSGTANTVPTGTSGSAGCSRRRLIVQLSPSVPPPAAPNGPKTEPVTEVEVATAVGAAMGGAVGGAVGAGCTGLWVYDANGEAGTSTAPLPNQKAANAVSPPQGGGHMSSGWVLADSSGKVHAYYGARDFGRIPFAQYGGAAVCKLLGASSPCTGTVTEATLQLLPVVLSARPLGELVATASQLTPLARSVGGSHILSVLYEDMLAQRPTAQTQQSLLQPSGLYHVAIDCPGCGFSPGDARAMIEHPEALLADVVRCLGKRHALMIVGEARAAACVLRAVSARPSLTSFVAVRDPSFEGGTAQPRTAISSLGLTTVLQPTLIVLDALVKRSKDAEGAAEPDQLRRSLPICSLVEASGTKKVTAALQMASQMFALCKAHEWRAHLPDLGVSDLPLLSRLVGDVSAWTKPGAPASQPATSRSAVSSSSRPEGQRRPRAKSMG